MEPIPGFVSVPRPAGSPRPAGAFFSAVVEAKAGPGSWRVTMDGRSLLVSSNLPLTPGQTLRLKLASQSGNTWLYQIIPPSSPGQQMSGADPNPLAAAFLSRGLPVVSERLAAWTRWLTRPGPSDKESWAASLEARGSGPAGPLTEQLSPWLLWQASLEEGKAEPPPDDDPWDEWNLKRPSQGDPWLVMPLRWEFEGQPDAGLLQAHWNPQGQLIDRWLLTAAPARVGFRLEAASRPGSLDLVWRFFNTEDRMRMEHWRRLREEDFLSLPGLRVSLEVAGPPPQPRLPGGVDVRA